MRLENKKVYFENNVPFFPMQCIERAFELISVTIPLALFYL
jgi:hypothetical protein